MAWTTTNEDGLVVKFGTDRAAVAGDGTESAKERIFEYLVADATTLADTDTATVDGDRPGIPSGAVITEAIFIVDTAFTSGGAATLDVGLKTADGSTVNDDDGLIAGQAVAGLTANAVIVGAGAQVNTKIANDLYPTVTYDTAAFTAGAGRLRVKYVI